MRILVIGGLGFLGSHLVPKLREEHTVAVMDVLPGCEIWKNVLDATREDFEGYDWIVDLASVTDVPLAIRSPRWTWSQNTDGILAVLEAIRGSNARLLYMSSESVYGQVPSHLRGKPITEDFPLNPVNVYGASKAAAEILIRSYPDINSVILRSSSMFGERGRPKQVIPIFIHQALRDEPIAIEGDGSQTRDFSYVGNQMHGIVQALEHGRAGLWNIASGTVQSVKEIAETIIRMTDSRSKIIHAPWRLGEKHVRLPMSIKKAQKELGYEPQVDFESGMRRTVEWYARTAKQN